MSYQEKQPGGWRLCVSTWRNPIASIGFSGHAGCLDLAMEVKFRPINDNPYTLQFSCLGDWDRVMKEGPWTFRANDVILARYDGFKRPSMIALDTVDTWIQIHDLPDGFFPLIKSLAVTVG